MLVIESYTVIIMLLLSSPEESRPFLVLSAQSRYLLHKQPFQNLMKVTEYFSRKVYSHMIFLRVLVDLGTALSIKGINTY